MINYSIYTFLTLQRPKITQQTQRIITTHALTKKSSNFHVLLTCSDPDLAADDFADIVGGRALVAGGVHVRPKVARLERQEIQAAVAEDLPDAGNRDDRLVVARQPVDHRHRAALRQAVDADARAVREVHFARRLAHETRTLVAERRHCNKKNTDIVSLH